MKEKAIELYGGLEEITTVQEIPIGALVIDRFMTEDGYPIYFCTMKRNENDTIYEDLLHGTDLPTLYMQDYNVAEILEEYMAGGGGAVRISLPALEEIEDYIDWNNIVESLSEDEEE